MSREEIRRLTEDVRSKAAEIQQLNRKLRDLTATYNQQSQQLAVKDNELRASKSSLEDIQRQIEILKAEKVAALQEHMKLKDDKRAMEDELAQVQQDASITRDVAVQLWTLLRKVSMKPSNLALSIPCPY